jgi:hypothetical protein
MEDSAMQSRIHAVAGKTLEVLEGFILTAMKTMFRRGASGAQIRSFLDTYLPDYEGLYGGQQVLAALQSLENQGALQRRGFRWCLTTM